MRETYPREGNRHRRTALALGILDRIELGPYMLVSHQPRTIILMAPADSLGLRR